MDKPGRIVILYHHTRQAGLLSIPVIIHTQRPITTPNKYLFLANREKKQRNGYISLRELCYDCQNHFE
jgi:hypothetical protein